MSDMKTFTVRQLDREPARILDTCDAEGAVQIRRRDGRTYILEANGRPGNISSVPDFVARVRKIFPKPISRAQTKRVDRMLAGE
jgi:hypothetical protein